MAKSIIKLTPRVTEKEAYDVTSDKGNQYIVNQSSESGLWYCSCKAFQFATRFDVPKGSKAYVSNRPPCKHINDVLNYREYTTVKKVEVILTEGEGINRERWIYRLKLSPGNLAVLHDKLMAMEATTNGRKG